MTMALAKQALLWGQRSSRLLPPFQEPPSFCRVPSLAAHPCPPNSWWQEGTDRAELAAEKGLGCVGGRYSGSTFFPSCS